MKKIYMITMMAIMLTFFLGGSALTGVIQDKDQTGTAVSKKQCIQSSRIKNSDVIDNQTIVFHMYHNKSWVNKLPYPCPNLYHEGGFKYVLHEDKLCSTDIITVLHTHAKCSLGSFEPYIEKKNIK